MRFSRPRLHLGGPGTSFKLAALAVALLLVASAALKFAPAATAQSSYSITESWVDQQLVAWAPTSVYPMNFGVPDLRISYANIYQSYNTQPVINSSLGMLESTGSNLVRIDMGFDAFLANDTATTNAFDTYVKWINDSGKGLVLADSSAERYRSYPLTWSNFKQQWYIRDYALALRYHPAYFIVVKEPGWYYPMISDSSTNAQVYNATDWMVLVQNLVTAVHLASPQTKVGVAVAAFDLYDDPAYQGRTSFNVQFLQDCEKVQNLSFIGFDIYDIPGFDGTQQFLAQNGNGGKAVWIAEAWSADGTVVTDPSRSTLDTNWIRALYYFGLKIHAQTIEPFYTDLFASYGTPPTDPSSLQQFYQNRTPVFNEFQQIISSNRAGELPPGNSTATTTSQSSVQTSSTASGSQPASTSTTASTLASSSGQGSPHPSSGAAELGGAADVILIVLVALAVVLRRRH